MRDDFDTMARKDSAFRYAPWERAFDRLISPFEEFIHRETTSGLFLLAATVAALVLANSPLAETYHHWLKSEVGFVFGPFELKKSLHHWINDGLMALFFFVVGLEIKREVLVGELSDLRAAALPSLAAIGGMVFPATFYLLLVEDPAFRDGWGIPMATDIAFAVGVMVLLGSRVPRALITFLVALAIVDDLGAVVVIALFYTEDLSMVALWWAAGLTALLALLNRVGVRRPLAYFFVGGLLWLALLKSGVHATLAGVITALAIPAFPKYDPAAFVAHVRRLMDRFEASHHPGQSILKNHEQYTVLQTLENGVHLVETPLQRLEHNLHGPVAYLIVPIFAFANAGIPLEFASLGETLTHPLTLGVAMALVGGKLVGIAGVSWVALRLGIGQLPAGARPIHLVGVGLLGGIGFTMSIFIAELAFGTNPEALVLAKTGILFSSLIAGIVGLLWLRFTTRPPTN